MWWRERASAKRRNAPHAQPCKHAWPCNHGLGLTFAAAASSAAAAAMSAFVLLPLRFGLGASTSEPSGAATAFARPRRLGASTDGPSPSTVPDAALAAATSTNERPYDAHRALALGAELAAVCRRAAMEVQPPLQPGARSIAEEVLAERRTVARIGANKTHFFTVRTAPGDAHNISARAHVRYTTSTRGHLASSSHRCCPSTFRLPYHACGAMTESSVMSGVPAVLQRICRALEGCMELGVPCSSSSTDDPHAAMQTAVTAMQTAIQTPQDMTYEKVVNGLDRAGVALDRLLAYMQASHEDARMGALRERIVGSGVLPDLMTALADVWSIASAEDLQEVSEVRPRTAIAGVFAPGRLPARLPQKHPSTPHANMLP
jgi:hypothetical protein